MSKGGWRQRFRGRVYRMTKSRQTICDVLDQTSEHLTAKQVYMRAHKKCPSCGMTTIYRTLELLVGMGLVTKFAFGEGQSRYELAEHYSGKPHHHHLVCRKCHKIVDYSNFLQDELDLVRRSEERLSKQFKFKIEEHEITFKGCCAKCQKSARG